MAPPSGGVVMLMNSGAAPSSCSLSVALFGATTDLKIGAVTRGGGGQSTYIVTVVVAFFPVRGLVTV